MSKGLDNLCNFNVSCKICNSKNVTAKELDGYIHLVCMDCEDLKKYETKIKDTDKTDLNSNFVKDLIKNTDNHYLKEVFMKIISDSEKALAIQDKIANILEEDYLKDTENEDSGLVLEDSLYKDEIFKLSEELKGLKVLEDVSLYANILMIGISIYNNPIYVEKFKCYELGYLAYDLIFEIDSYNYDCKLDDVYNDSRDTIYMGDEIGSKIEIERKYLNEFKKFISEKL